MQTFLNSTTHSVAWFAKIHQGGELELKTPFQRNPVWTPKQQGYLIDTILRGFPVPELYMQEFTSSEGHERYVVVDGQQRLRACLGFLDGQVSLDPVDSPDFADMSFDDLSPDQKKQVFNYNFVVRVLPDMPEPELRNMFQRLNRNVVALNPQELRHAAYWGEFIKTVEGLGGDERWASCGIFTPNDIRRMLDIEFISEVVVAYLHGVQNKKDKLEEWYQAYEREFPQKETTEEVFKKTLGELLAILPEVSKTRYRKKSDFYSLFLVLARYATLMPFSREGRSELRGKLTKFADEVDRYFANPDASDIPESAKQYARAVERAASDLAARQERESRLLGLVTDVVAAEQASR